MTYAPVDFFLGILLTLTPEGPFLFTEIYSTPASLAFSKTQQTEFKMKLWGNSVYMFLMSVASKATEKSGPYFLADILLKLDKILRSFWVSLRAKDDKKGS